MSKQSHGLRGKLNARTQLLNEISRLKLAIKVKETLPTEQSIVSDLKELLAKKEAELEELK